MKSIKIDKSEIITLLLIILTSFVIAISGYTMVIIAVIAGIVLFIPLIIWGFKSGGSSSSVPEVAPTVAPAVETAIAQFLRKASRRR